MSNFLRSTSEILAAYMDARRIYDSLTPSDPVASQIRQAKFYKASDALTQALDRNPNRVGIF